MRGGGGVLSVICTAKDGPYQREGMDLLENQASLRDVAHDGVLCTFSNTSQPQAGASGVVRQGRRHGPSITYKITRVCKNVA